jgi:hypothetical protein
VCAIACNRRNSDPLGLEIVEDFDHGLGECLMIHVINNVNAVRQARRRIPLVNSLFIWICPLPIVNAENGTIARSWYMDFRTESLNLIIRFRRAVDLIIGQVIFQPAPRSGFGSVAAAHQPA